MRIWVALLGAVFFFTPVIALLVGARAGRIENRRLAPPPSLSDGWAFFPHLARWAEDRLPLRGEAVRANTAISTHVFGEAPAYGKPGQAPEVMLGKDGWLFLTADFANACHPTRSLAATEAGVARLQRMVESTGRKFLLFVAPDKTTVEHDLLPGSAPEKACAERAKAAFARSVAADPPAGWVDLYGEVKDLRAKAGAPVYRKKDSHWGLRAAGLLARDVVQRIDPELLLTSRLERTSPVTDEGDLTVLLGAAADNTYPGWRWARAGVTRTKPRQGAIFGVWRRGAVSTDAPLHRQPVLFVGDSFLRTARPMLEPFFADWSQVDIGIGAAHPDVLAHEMLRSPVVVVVSAERNFATGRVSLFSPKTLDALQNALDHQRYLSRLSSQAAK